LLLHFSYTHKATSPQVMIDRLIDTGESRSTQLFFKVILMPK
jgi:hypothetical protein